MPVSSTATFAQPVRSFQAAGASMSSSLLSASAYCSSKPGSSGFLATATGTLSSTRSTLGAARSRSRSASSDPSPTLTEKPRTSRASVRADRPRRVIARRRSASPTPERNCTSRPAAGRDSPEAASHGRRRSEAAPRPAQRRPRRDDGRSDRPAGTVSASSFHTLLRPGEGRLAFGRDALEVLADRRNLLAHVATPEQPRERGDVGLAALRRDLGLGLRGVALGVRLGRPARSPSRRRRSRRRPAVWPPPRPARPGRPPSARRRDPPRSRRRPHVSRRAPLPTR